MNWLETKFISLLSSHVRNFRRINERLYNFSCPICGDSKKNKRKARGFIYEDKSKVWYKCHNCGLSLAFHRLIERVDQILYQDYQKERISAGLWTSTGRRTSNPAPDYTSQPSSLKPPEVRQEGGDPLRLLTRVDRLGDDHPARAFCTSRMLPDLTRVYHCPLFCSWVNYFIPRKFHEGMTGPEKDHPRLVIPFLDRGGGLFAFAARAYDGRDPKYITIKIDEDAQKVFGLDRHDPERRSYVVEGPIDSMFIENCLAVAGGDPVRIPGLEPTNTTWVSDNEPRSKDTKKRMLKAIKMGYGVVVWPKSVSHKDVNDMIKAGMSQSEVQSVIDDNTYRGLSAEAEVAAWSKA